MREPERVVVHRGRKSKDVLDLSQKDPEKDVEDDATSATRSVSTKASTFASSASSECDTEFLEPASSWNFEQSPIAVPKGLAVRLPPSRRLHEKHVKKLNGFLLDVHRRPVILETMIESRREASVAKASFGSLSRSDSCETMTMLL